MRLAAIALLLCACAHAPADPPLPPEDTRPYCDHVISIEDRRLFCGPKTLASDAGAAAEPVVTATACVPTEYVDHSEFEPSHMCAAKSDGGMRCASLKRYVQGVLFNGRTGQQPTEL